MQELDREIIQTDQVYKRVKKILRSKERAMQMVAIAHTRLMNAQRRKIKAWEEVEKPSAETQA